MRDKGLSLVGVWGLNHLHDSLLRRDGSLAQKLEASMTDEATSPLRRPWRLRWATQFSLDRTTVKKPVIECHRSTTCTAVILFEAPPRLFAIADKTAHALHRIQASLKKQHWRARAASGRQLITCVGIRRRMRRTRPSSGLIKANWQACRHSPVSRHAGGWKPHHQLRLEPYGSSACRTPHTPNKYRIIAPWTASTALHNVAGATAQSLGRSPASA